MIKLGFVYVLAGLVFGGFAVFSASDRANPKRFGNAAFWGLASLSFLAGDRLGDLGNGLLVLSLAAARRPWTPGRGQPATTSPGERRALSERFGNRLFIPALMLPLIVALGLLVLKPVTLRRTAADRPEAGDADLAGSGGDRGPQRARSRCSASR